MRLHPHLPGMDWRARWHHWRETPAGRRTLFLIGWALVLTSPIIGAVPGPGGIFVFAAGAAMILETSIAAKRLFVRAARRWPRFGRYANRALRRHRHKASRPNAPDRAVTD